MNPDPHMEKLRMTRILFVDDEPNIVELVVTACKELGHDTFPFISSQKALDQLDAVIATIRANRTPPEAKAALCEGFAFSEIQAQAILDMRLQRLTGLELVVRDSGVGMTAEVRERALGQEVMDSLSPGQQVPIPRLPEYRHAESA